MFVFRELEDVVYLLYSFPVIIVYSGSGPASVSCYGHGCASIDGNPQRCIGNRRSGNSWSTSWSNGRGGSGSGGGRGGGGGGWG